MPIPLGVIAAVDMFLNYSLAQQKLALLMKQAQSEGRDIAQAELAVINADLKKSFDNLDQAIEEKGG